MTEDQKKEITKMMMNLKPKVEVKFSSFDTEQRNHIMQMIINQKRSLGFEIETNGTSEDPSSITKFRKLILPVKIDQKNITIPTNSYK